MKRFFLFQIIFLILFISCGPSSKGKIINRSECSNSGYWYAKTGSQEQFLVNTSNSEKITFTLKTTSNMHTDTMNNKIYKLVTTYTTETFTLNPGEEISLGCSKLYTRENDEIWCTYSYEIVGALIEK